jgi:peroxiredoxin
LKSFKTLALAIVTTGAILYSCSGSQPAHTKQVAQESSDAKAAPDFKLKDSSGATVQLSDYRGKVVLLNFWATWCGPCKMEIPWFVQFEQQYKNKGFAVVGVSMDDDGWNAVKPYIAEKKVNYRVVLGTDSVASLYGGIDALPTTFVIDREGRIQATHVGLINRDEYQKEIEGLLGSSETKSAGASAGVLPALFGFGPAR